MLEDVIVVGVVMALTELIKIGLKRIICPDLVTRLMPLFVLSLAGLANMANAAVFAPEFGLVPALRDGLVLGAVAGGVYSMGKAALGRS